MKWSSSGWTKYFAPERVGVLANANLRYSPLGAFSDPFEGRPEFTALASDAEALQTIDQVLPVQLKAMYDALPAEVQAVVPEAGLLALLEEHMREKRIELLDSLRALTKPAVAFIQLKLDEQIGCLCLSEQPDSLLMWSHYGASHTGFVVQFDAHHNHFWQQRSTEDEFRHLRRVVYRDTRPSATLTEFDGLEWFLVKSSHWSYEREWRILRALSEAEKTVPGEPFPTCLFSFPRSAVTSVILGSRISATTESQVRAALVASGEYRVTVMRAIPDPTHFHLRIIDAAT